MLILMIMILIIKHTCAINIALIDMAIIIATFSIEKPKFLHVIVVNFDYIEFLLLSAFIFIFISISLI